MNTSLNISNTVYLVLSVKLINSSKVNMAHRTTFDATFHNSDIVWVLKAIKIAIKIAAFERYFL